MAGEAKVVCAGGLKTDANTFLQQTRDILDVGACGVAVGRNVWQSEQPDNIARALEALIFGNAPVSKAAEALSA
jgi:class I fructose-bisphosphate aldolase